MNKYTHNNPAHKYVSEGKELALAGLFAGGFKVVGMVDKEGKTPLHVACEVGALWAIPILIKNKIDVNQKDFKGYRAVDYANIDTRIFLYKFV